MQSPQQLVGVRPVHSGPLFNVFRATLAGVDIAIKRPADTVRWNEALATAWTHSNPTNVFHHVQLGWAEPEPLPGVSYVEALLRAEQTVLESAATHWNHPGAKLARWRHDDTLGPADDVEAGPLCMLMPWCSGVALGSLPREEQRRWFPAMLPALWQALAVCPHGDLSPADLMLERTQGFFRIFDPGVRISGPSYPAAQRGGSLDFDSHLFTTNTAHYLLIEPEHGPTPPKQPAPAGGLEAIVENQAKPRFERALAARPAKPGLGPAAADVAACGALYFNILTGTQLGNWLGLKQPLWTGFWGDRGHQPEVNRQCLDALDMAALTRALREAGATGAEATLCAHLLRLELDEESLRRDVTPVLRG